MVIFPPCRGDARQAELFGEGLEDPKLIDGAMEARRGDISANEGFNTLGVGVPMQRAKRLLMLKRIWIKQRFVMDEKFVSILGTSTNVFGRRHPADRDAGDFSGWIAEHDAFIRVERGAFEVLEPGVDVARGGHKKISHR